MPRRDRVCPAVVLVEGEAIIRAHVMLVSGRDVPRGRTGSSHGLRLLRSYERPVELVLGGDAMPLTSGLELARVLVRAPHPVPVLFVSTHRWLAMHRPEPRRGHRRVQPVAFDADRILEFLESLRVRARAA
jgi:FixJ family two-component response regulator